MGAATSQARKGACALMTRPPESLRGKAKGMDYSAYRFEGGRLVVPDAPSFEIELTRPTYCRRSLSNSPKEKVVRKR